MSDTPRPAHSWRNRPAVIELSAAPWRTVADEFAERRRLHAAKRSGAKSLAYRRELDRAKYQRAKARRGG